jgi:hypothetical protein
VELQISHRICAKVSKKGVLRRKKTGDRSSIEDTVQVEGG